MVIVKRHPVLVIYRMFSLLLHYCSLICDWHVPRQSSHWERILKSFNIGRSRNMGPESLTFLSFFHSLSNILSL